jgi:hypothetical protein
MLWVSSSKLSVLRRVLEILTDCYTSLEKVHPDGLGDDDIVALGRIQDVAQDLRFAALRLQGQAIKHMASTHLEMSDRHLLKLRSY